MKKKEFNRKKIFSEASGSMAVSDTNINMILNEFGLYEESLIEDSNVVSEEALLVSPNLNNNVNEQIMAEKLYGKTDSIKFDSRIGFYETLYVGHVNEGDFRKNASSGGLGTWILKELFDNDLIDYVIHVKYNSDSDLLFKYDISATIDEIKDGAKTKYYPVELSKVIEQLKKNPGRYVVVGIPSFIYAVRLLADHDPIVKERIKYTVGLVCGHQKSSKFAEAMAWQMGIKPGNLKYIDFRYKIPNESADKYAVKVYGEKNGEMTTIITPTSELFGQNWGWGLFKSFASDYTDDVFNETADIVLGDAWLPEYTIDSEGNNIVIVRNPIIEKLIKKALRENRITMNSVDADKIFESQSSHFRHTHDELSYRLYQLEEKNIWHPNKRVFANKKNITRDRKKIQNLRIEISKLSHTAYQDAVNRDDFNYFVNTLNPLITKYENTYKFIHRKKMIKNIKNIGYIEFAKKATHKMKRMLLKK